MTDSKFKCNIFLFLSVTVFMARLSMYVSFFLSFSYPYPTKWGRYNMFSSCCGKDSANLYDWPPALRQPSMKLDVNDCKYSRDQQLNVQSTKELEIINFGHPSND
jgi:hypothetical protein